MNYIDTQNLKNYSIQAKDGKIGHVSDFYFDQNFFYLRYLVLDTEPFLSRNLVLVSPIGFHKIDSEKKVIEVSLTKKELEDSPSFDSKQTVSRLYEEAYSKHFSWPYYWGMTGSPWGVWGIGPYGITATNYSYYRGPENNDATKSDMLEEATSCNLRSSKEICSYSVEGTDKTFGNIKGFILNPESLAIDFLVIDTINYLPSKNVLLRPEWIENISWDSKSVKFPFTKNLISSAPAYENGKLDEKLIRNTDKHFHSVLGEHDKFNSNEENVFDLKRARNQIELISEKETVVGHIPSGLFVVTAKNKETNEYEGFLASWVQQASFDPLLVSLCIKDNRPGIETVLNKSQFCINVVGKDSTDYLKHFTNKKVNRVNSLDKVPHHMVEGKGVFIDGAKSVIVCRAHEITHPGDHYLVTAEVTDGVILNNMASSATYVRHEGSHY